MSASHTTPTNGSPTAVSSIAAVIACGCLISLVTFGIRSSLGLFTAPISEGRGWSREVYALAMALQNIVWGLGQPLAGGLADRYGPARVLAAGGALYALGMVLMPFSTTPLTLYLTSGVLVGLGMSGGSFVTVLAAFGRFVPEDRRWWALGMGTAAGSLGQFLIAPLGQMFISAYGWSTSLVLLGGFAATVPALALAFRRTSAVTGTPSGLELSFGGALSQAFGHRSYVLLTTGFFVCGFQLAFITVHLPPYLTDAGAGASLAAWAIAMVGLFNVVGAYTAGVLGGRTSKKNLLSAIYLGRAVATLLFFLLPVGPLTVMLFAASMGLFWLSTVPLTSGLVALMFGTQRMATLWGFVFLSHQIGSFFGVWLGGLIFERTGSYDAAWWLTIVLGLAAAVVHLPIVERRAARAAVAGG